jgi:RNA polymerase sigma-70 factor (ECF subfamily)
MIKGAAPNHSQGGGSPGHVMPHASDTAPTVGLMVTARASDLEQRRRLTALVDGHLDATGRILRHLGAPPDELEDLLQQAFAIVAARLGDIEPGKERAFLIETAVRLAASARRLRARSREVVSGQLPDLPDGAPSPEDLSERSRALHLLDRILDQMHQDLRCVFVLFEIEEMTMAEIANVLELPPGTVASRLRRARDEFLERVRRAGVSRSAPPPRRDRR